MTHVTPHKNPYAAVWAEAERRLVQQIHQVHELGVSIDKSRKGLHWQGGSERRFQQRADTRHHDLHVDNDTLRSLLRLVRLAAETKPVAVPKATTNDGGVAA